MDLQPPTPSQEVVLQRVGEEAILHDRLHGQAHVINESAARIWELCNGHNTPEQIASALAASYAVPASLVQDDVQTILARFRALGLLS